MEQIFQVCTFWNELIKDKVWKSEVGKKGLSTKLRHRWVTLEPRLDLLAKAKAKAKNTVTSLCCNDKHIFCGDLRGLVGVYSISS